MIQGRVEGVPPSCAGREFFEVPPTGVEGLASFKRSKASDDGLPLRPHGRQNKLLVYYEASENINMSLCTA